MFSLCPQHIMLVEHSAKCRPAELDGKVFLISNYIEFTENSVSTAYYIGHKTFCEIHIKHFLFGGLLFIL